MTLYGTIIQDAQAKSLEDTEVGEKEFFLFDKELKDTKFDCVNV